MNRKDLFCGLALHALITKYEGQFTDKKIYLICDLAKKIGESLNQRLWEKESPEVMKNREANE